MTLLVNVQQFMQQSCKRDVEKDLQIIQNDTLRICNMSRTSDKISTVELHAKCKMISLEQCMRTQHLWLMYLLSRDAVYLRVSN